MDGTPKILEGGGEDAVAITPDPSIRNTKHFILQKNDTDTPPDVMVPNSRTTRFFLCKDDN